MIKYTSPSEIFPFAPRVTRTGDTEHSVQLALGQLNSFVLLMPTDITTQAYRYFQVKSTAEFHQFRGLQLRIESAVFPRDLDVRRKIHLDSSRKMPQEHYNLNVFQSRVNR